MPYQADRHFNVIPKGTDTLIHYSPGDYVLDFASWPDQAQRTHLNQGLVVRCDAPPPAISEQEAEDLEAADASAPKAKGRGRPKKAAHVPAGKIVAPDEALGAYDPLSDKAGTLS